MLDEILGLVEKPARYIGGEIGEVQKNINDISTRFLWCYPDLYEVGMSHLGTKIMYHKINERPDTWCERVFAPDFDMEKELRDRNMPVFSLESATPAKKRSGKAALLLTAGICLLAGFLLGRLSLPNPEPNPETSKPSGTVGIFDSGTTGNPGIADDYASMSTQELVNIAVTISSLSYFGSPTASSILTPETYEVLSRINPVLTELEQRPDAIKELSSMAISVSNIHVIHAANALIGYYVNHCGHEIPEDMISGYIDQ